MLTSRSIRIDNHSNRPLAKASMSRFGLTLCALYCVAVVACAMLSMGDGGDSKGAFVLLQLPIALQGGLLQALGLGRLIEGLSWTTAYLALGIPTLILLYFTGRFLGNRLSSWLA